jgi:hypothetical protein
LELVSGKELELLPELDLSSDFLLDVGAGSAAYSILAAGEPVLFLLEVVVRDRSDEERGAWSCRKGRERASDGTKEKERAGEVPCAVVFRQWWQTKGEADVEDIRDSWLASPSPRRRRAARRIGAGWRYVMAAGSQLRLQRQYSSRKQTHWVGSEDAEALSWREHESASLE